MRRFVLVLVFTFAAAFLLIGPPARAEKVEFQPVRAPSYGTETAPVTVYEIADFM